MQVGFLVVGHRIIELDHQFAERIRRSVGEDDDRRLVAGLADVAERLPALRSRGNQGGIGTTTLPRLRSRGARLLGRRFTTKTQRIKNKRKEHSIHWLASPFLIL